MNKVLENLMNFINENTTLLIIICVFLIFVLIGYLIDNSIKTRKIEQKLLKDNDDNRNIEEDINEKIETQIDDVPTPEVNLEKPIEETNPIVEEKNINNEITVSEEVNDTLLRDFAENGDKTVDVTPSVEESIVTEEEIKEEIIPPVSEENTTEPTKEDSIYKNDKKLSDIFKKAPKTEVIEDSKPNLEKTVDFNNELDRILKKLNDTPSNETKDSTLEETTDFTNMF